MEDKEAGGGVTGANRMQRSLEDDRVRTANMGGSSFRHCLRTRERYPSAPMRILACTEGRPSSKCTVTPFSSSSYLVICGSIVIKELLHRVKMYIAASTGRLDQTVSEHMAF